MTVGDGPAVRPEVDPVVLAVLAAAVEQTWPRAVVAEAATDRPSAWRFSGRWWATPLPLRRARPAAF